MAVIGIMLEETLRINSIGMTSASSIPIREKTMFEEAVNEGDHMLCRLRPCATGVVFNKHLLLFSQPAFTCSSSDNQHVAGTYQYITGRAFVARIRKISECSASSFVVGAIYLERLRQHDESVMLSMGTFRRLFLVSVMLAAKFLDDQHVSNRQVAISAYASNESCTRGRTTFAFRAGFHQYTYASTLYFKAPK